MCYALSYFRKKKNPQLMQKNTKDNREEFKFKQKKKKKGRNGLEKFLGEIKHILRVEFRKKKRKQMP